MRHAITIGRFEFKFYLACLFDLRSFMGQGASREIGVGRIRRRSPSLLTVLADLPHTALQLMGHLFKGLTALTRAAVREYSPCFTKNASGQR